MGSWGAPGHMALTGVSRWSIWSEVTNDTWVGNVSSTGMLHAAQSTVITRLHYRYLHVMNCCWSIQTSSRVMHDSAPAESSWGVG